MALTTIDCQSTTKVPNRLVYNNLRPKLQTNYYYTTVNGVTNLPWMGTNDVLMTSRSQKPLGVGGVAIYLHFFVMTRFV
jgi:hypothetical protein